MKNQKLIILFLLLSGAFLINACKKKDPSSDCPNCPAVISISPTQAHGGDDLTITGKNFSSDPQSNIVKINGVQVNIDSIVSATTTQIVVKVPKGCGTGSVTVDLDAELTNFGTPPVMTYLYRYTVIDIGGIGQNVQPCIGGQSVCNVTNYLRPYGIVVDQSDNVFFSDNNLNCIYKLDASNGYAPCMFAGCAGNTNVGSLNGSGTYAQFSYPAFMCIDNNNSIFLAENSSTIRTISPSGTSADWYSDNNLIPVDGGIYFTQDNSGTAFVTNLGYHTIWKIVHSGNTFTATHFAGSTGNSGHADGMDSTATFNNPSGIVVDRSGNVIVADRSNNMIRKISPSGLVTTLAGNTAAGFANGQGALAGFNQPYGLCIDDQNNIYVADNLNNAIRKISSTGFVSTVYQFTGSMNNPFPLGVARDSHGNFYVTYTSGFGNGVKKIIVE